MTAADYTPREEEQIEYILKVMRMTIPNLTRERFLEGHKRFKEQEAIRKEKEAARRKARRDAKKEQGA